MCFVLFSHVFIFPTISLSAIFLSASKISPRSFYLINYLFMLTAFYWRQFQFENEETTIFPFTSTADKYKHDGDRQTDVYTNTTKTGTIRQTDRLRQIRTRMRQKQARTQMMQTDRQMKAQMRQTRKLTRLIDIDI